MSLTIINHIKKFATISASTESFIRQHARTKSLRKDAYLRLHSEDFVFVAQGLLMKIADEDDRVCHFVPETDIIIYPPPQESHSFLALEPCSLRIMAHHDIMRLIAQDMALCTAYHKLVGYWAAQRMQRTELLLLPAAQRKQAFYTQFRKIAGRIPHKYIASYLNMTPSYFSQL